NPTARDRGCTHAGALVECTEYDHRDKEHQRDAEVGVDPHRQVEQVDGPQEQERGQLVDQLTDQGELSFQDVQQRNHRDDHHQGCTTRTHQGYGDEDRRTPGAYASYTR